MCGHPPELSFYFTHQCRMLLQVSSKFCISRIQKMLHYRILQPISELRLKGGVILAQAATRVVTIIIRCFFSCHNLKVFSCPIIPCRYVAYKVLSKKLTEKQEKQRYIWHFFVCHSSNCCLVSANSFWSVQSFFCQCQDVLSKIVFLDDRQVINIASFYHDNMDTYHLYGKSEIPVRKSNSSRYSVWEAK